MSASCVYVENAARMADALTRDALDRPNDFSGALRRVSEKTGVGYGTLWSLRYRLPQRIFADAYFRISAEYEALRRRQLEALEIELERAKAGGRHHADHIRESEAFLARNKVGTEL